MLGPLVRRSSALSRSGLSIVYFDQLFSSVIEHHLGQFGVDAERRSPVLKVRRKSCSVNETPDTSTSLACLLDQFEMALATLPPANT
jgi:hypothetical protein